jgi:quercetin dioxygenase-like cupin family protein
VEALSFLCRKRIVTHHPFAPKLCTYKQWNMEAAMRRTVGLSALALIAGTALVADGGWLANAQQQTIKRTDLLKVDLPEIKGSQMNLWVADIAPGGETGRHTHPTPRFVYVLEGAVTLEMDGKPSQTFRAGQAFVEMPNMVHNFKNASTTEPAKGLGFQYAAEGQALQVNAP